MINKLVKKIKETNAPVVVGLDPMLSYIPKHMLNLEKHLRVCQKHFGSIIKELSMQHTI